MNKLTAPSILLLILLSFSAFAATGTETPEYDTSDGNWTNPEYAADTDYTNYAQCVDTSTAECRIWVNFSYAGHTPSVMTSIIWGVNLSQVVNGVEVTVEPNCIVTRPVVGLIVINRTGDPDTNFYCLDKTAPGTYINIGSGNFTEYNISGMYQFWTDPSPVVDMVDTINGTTKACAENTNLIESDIIFQANDTTDTEFNCCVYVNSVQDASSCNSSIQNATTSTLHTDALLSGQSNTVEVGCQDENGIGYSNAMTLVGDTCFVCSGEFMDALLKFGIIMALFFGLGASVIKNKKYMAYFLAICLFVLAMVLVIWYAANWNTLC